MSQNPIHGNYHGYYTKRPSVRDPRLALLPNGLFKGGRVLDVGCNEGWITCEIAQSFGPKEVIGVDIDDTLVRAAWRRRRTVWSQQLQPLSSSQYEGSADESVKGPPRKRQRPYKAPQEEQEERTHKKFPAAFEHMFGPLPIPPPDKNESLLYPHNVVFKTSDWVKNGVIDDGDGYDVVLALSITKWIHLNNGDEGLRNFFRRVYSVLKKNGVLVLEPQEWESYAKAKRMDYKLKRNAQSLRLLPSEFEHVLIEIGFGRPEHLGSTGKGGFQRPLDLYRKS